MTATRTAARPAPARSRAATPDGGVRAAEGGSPGGPATVAYVLVSAVVRGVSAALAGVLLLGGLALLVWAITPATGSNAGGLLRSSMVVLAAGHFLPVTVAGAALTIHPLTVSIVAVLIVASSAARGRAVRGRSMEAVHGLVLAVAYAATVDLIVRSLVPAGEVRATAAPFVLAGVGVVLGLATHRTGWNRWWRRTAPSFLRFGLRGGSAMVCLLMAAGATVFAVGLATSFHDALAVARLTAPGAGDGLALALMSLAFLPNAAIAGAGYLTGAGFTVGAASYSPFGSTPVELPAIPLLTAAPDAHSAGRAEWLVLAVPVLIGVLIATWIDRRLGLRWQRMAAAATASVVAGLGVAGLAVAAAGGVAGGPWTTSGVPPLLAGAAVAGSLAVVSLAWTAVAGMRSVRWRAERPVPDSDVTADPGVELAHGALTEDLDGAADLDGSATVEVEPAVESVVESVVESAVDDGTEADSDTEAGADIGTDGGAEADRQTQSGVVEPLEAEAGAEDEPPAEDPDQLAFDDVLAESAERPSADPVPDAEHAFPAAVDEPAESGAPAPDADDLRAG